LTRGAQERLTMQATTIDNLDIKIHERYAQDQKVLDKTLLTDAALLSPHLDLAATSISYASKWEELFELGVRNLPWAAFTAPPSFRRQANRFFSFRLLPTISLLEEDEEEAQDEEEQEKKKESELLKKAIAVQKKKHHDAILFERDKTAIVNLLQMVTHLDQLLSQVNSRKLQYQKG
jgi:uncharacterized protein DUF5399